VYRTVQFASAWPDDSKFDPEGNLLVPGAKDLLAAISKQLQREVSEITGINQHSFYGWEFSCSFDRARFNCVLNPAGEQVYLTLHYGRFWLDMLRWRGPRQRFDAFCKVVDAAVRRIGRVSEVVWSDYRA
jgi:hypothetical protein